MNATRALASSFDSIKREAEGLSDVQKLELIKCLIEDEDFADADQSYVDAVSNGAHELWLIATAEPEGDAREDAADRAYYEWIVR